VINIQWGAKHNKPITVKGATKKNKGNEIVGRLSVEHDASSITKQTNATSKHEGISQSTNTLIILRPKQIQFSPTHWHRAALCSASLPFT